MNERLLKSQKQASVKNKSRLIWDLSEAEKEMCDNIVVGEADCCQESDLCSSSDRETSCIADDFDQGS